MDAKECLKKVFQKYGRRKGIHIESLKEICEMTRVEFDEWLYDQRSYFERKKNDIRMEILDDLRWWYRQKQISHFDFNIIFLEEEKKRLKDIEDGVKIAEDDFQWMDKVRDEYRWIQLKLQLETLIAQQSIQPIAQLGADNSNLVPSTPSDCQEVPDVAEPEIDLENPELIHEDKVNQCVEEVRLQIELPLLPQQYESTILELQIASEASFSLISNLMKSHELINHSSYIKTRPETRMIPIVRHAGIGLHHFILHIWLFPISLQIQLISRTRSCAAEANDAEQT